MTTQRMTISVNHKTVEQLRVIQEKMKKELGVDLSVTQAIDYLVKYYFDKEPHHD
jgi:hypothetical protein